MTEFKRAAWADIPVKKRGGYGRYINEVKDMLRTSEPRTFPTKDAKEGWRILSEFRRAAKTEGERIAWSRNEEGTTFWVWILRARER